MTLQGPDFVALQVEDLGRAESFYTEVIGLTRAQVRPEAVIFATDNDSFRRAHTLGFPAGAVRARSGRESLVLYRRCPRPPYPPRRGGCPHRPTARGRAVRANVYLHRPGRLPHHRSRRKVSAVHYWVNTVSKNHVMVGRQAGFVQANHGKAAPLARLGRGDLMVFYSPKEVYGGTAPCHRSGAACSR